MVEVMKIMVTSFKQSHAFTATFSALNPAAGHHQSMPPLDIHRQVWVSLLWVGGVTAPFSWVLVHKVLFVHSKSLFPSLV